MANTFAVIMAGGSGTRFWPASREHRPKQLLPLAGAREETLLAATVRRLSSLIPPENVFVVTGRKLAEATRAALPNVPANQILIEPIGRNTAPCIAWATSAIEKRDPNALVCVLPSDHFISDEPAFVSVIEKALASAAAGRVTTVGIVPTRPETGYGYVEVGEEIGGDAKRVVRFVEKPHLETATGYVAGKKHLWNAGMFFFRAREMSALVKAHLPALAEGIAKIANAAGSPNEAKVIEDVFPTLPSISIDHGVMEKSADLAVVPGVFGWNDVGSWLSAWELAEKDERGNALAPNALAIDANNNLVVDLTTHPRKKTVAVVGVSGLVIVKTDDAVLVIPKDRAQDVRSVIEALKAASKHELL